MSLLGPSDRLKHGTILLIDKQMDIFWVDLIFLWQWLS